MELNLGQPGSVSGLAFYLWTIRRRQRPAAEGPVEIAPARRVDETPADPPTLGK